MVCEISRIQPQKVVSITSSLKRVIRKGWFVAYQDLNKEDECCKRALANGSRHVFAFAQKIRVL